MKKVSSGDPLDYSAGTHNRFIDSTLFTESLRDSKGRLPKIDVRMDGICYVKNSSGGNRARYSALGIDGPLFNPRNFHNSFTQGIVLNGVTPDISVHSGKFVILAEPLNAGEVGLAWCSGVCPALLDPTTLDDAADPTHADIVDGETAQLKGGGAGAPIVWLDSIDDGYDRWALIRLDTNIGVQRFISAETNKVGGPVVSADTSILMWLVAPDGSHSIEDGTRVVVDCTSLNGLIFPSSNPVGHFSLEPAYIGFAYHDGIAWRAFAGGVTSFEGSVATLGPITVTPDLGGDNVPSLQATSFCDEELLVGLNVLAQINNAELRIYNACCGSEDVGT